MAGEAKLAAEDAVVAVEEAVTVNERASRNTSPRLRRSRTMSSNVVP